MVTEYVSPSAWLGLTKIKPRPRSLGLRTHQVEAATDDGEMTNEILLLALGGLCTMGILVDRIVRWSHVPRVTLLLLCGLADGHLGWFPVFLAAGLVLRAEVSFLIAGMTAGALRTAARVFGGWFGGSVARLPGRERFTVRAIRRAGGESRANQDAAPTSK